MKTEQKQLEKEFNESGSTFRLLFERSADAMLLLDGDVFIDCNPAAVKIFACSEKKQLLSFNPSDLSPEKQPDGSFSRKEENKRIAKAIEQGSNRFEWLHQRINGEAFPVEVLLTSISAQRKKLIHVVLRDISERKKVDNALRDSEKKYKFLFEKSTVLNCITDMNGIITEINSKFLEILGYPRNEVIGRNIIDFVIAEQREKAAEQLAKDFKGEESPEIDVDMLAKDGSTRTILCSRGPALLYEGDAPAGFLLITVIDITDRKRAEDALKMALSEVGTLKNRLQDENLYLQDEIKLSHNFEEIIGKSDAIKNILGKVEQVATTDSTVLILGETGTGKELIARAVHNISGRSDRPLVKVNCAALPANIIESELFGHEKGAFTGAYARKIGRFELANMGTIFLDEIGDLPMDLQVKLLRVLQDGEFERLGNPNTIKVDIRIIAATNRDLEKAIANNAFREDLYYRLNVFPIKVPSLRERKADIPFLVNHFIKKFCKKIGRKIEIIPQRVMDGLLTYDWPGNIRELENIIERAVIVCQGKRLEVGDWLPQKNMPAGAFNITILEEVERAHILKVLESTRWQVSGEKGAAKVLGLNQNTLVSRMKKLNIHR
ncbi:MAG: sigma 54-interacting transcriptional regulator [Thermodesulfobacteriota bacterium]|nr:sigma 54-interacting transcriptional regulator [Thermodesulfobacteriota bacterium]